MHSTAHLFKRHYTSFLIRNITEYFDFEFDFLFLCSCMVFLSI